MAYFRSALQQITKRLLRPATVIGERFKATNDLYALFNEAERLDWRKSEHSSDVQLSSGKAAGVVWAAMCIKDTERTHRFLQGLYMAILDIQARLPGQTIHVLYAGTGPFATLALPLTTVFTPEEVQFTFLEINPESILILQKVIEVFEAAPFVAAVVQEDATTFQHDQGYPIHIAVSETMQAGLLHEPQVAIFRNLAPQLAPGGILIPQLVSVDAAVLDPVKNTERMTSLDILVTDHYQIIGPVFELTLAKLLANGGDFPAKTHRIPRDLGPGPTKLVLLTHIQVYDTILLTYWESMLTQPVILISIPPEMLGKTVQFKYRMGIDPQFEWQIQD